MFVTKVAIGWAWLLVLALPAAAFAQEDGLTVDPDSPSAKEYAIPLDDARGQASGGDATGGTARQATPSPAPLFGVGVGEDAGGAAGPTGSGEQPGGQGRPDRAAPTPGGTGRTDALPAAALKPTPQEDASSLLLLGGGTGLVLGLGALAGLAMRRRSHPGAGR